MSGARFEIDPRGLLELALDMAPYVEGIAQDVVDEVQDTAPRDSGDYADSWKVGRARLDPGGRSISALAYSRHRPPGAKAPLGIILELGAELEDGTVLPPQPHIRAAADRVQQRRARG